ncbi:MAG: Wzz/FepE/Etk N-terminal domain-containing protein, partial [Planctomycetales bacterium]|nr:Wzz/FepE/Etk N-terminal domain-containing protein [Planctomycetales bacterium]
MDLKDYLRILRRQWKIAALIFLAVPVLYYVYLSRQPRIFASSATLLVPRTDLQFSLVVSEDFVPDTYSYATRVALLTSDRVTRLAARERFIQDANDISGDIVLRAAKRGRNASELMGVVL